MAQRRTCSHPRHVSIAREPSLYSLTPDASGGIWDLYRVSREFDSETGDFHDALLDRLNGWASGEPAFSQLHIRPEASPARRPGEILLLDGSPSRLPLAAETARVMGAHLRLLGLSIPVRVLNRREELLARAARAPGELLVISQAAQRSLYDATLARALETRGVVVVPGVLTAPGGPLSNKKITYELLNGDGADAQAPGRRGCGRRLTAPYEEVDLREGGPAEAAAAILDAASALTRRWRTTAFFVKPQEGGGGRGCFRLDVFPDGFGLPDLSKLGMAAAGAIPLPPSLDAENLDHVQAMRWLFHRFRSSPATSDAYIKKTRISAPAGRGDVFPGAFLQQTLRDSAPRLRAQLRASALSRQEAIRLLARAIENYEQLFDARYLPLICDWIDFGLFSVRAHLRLSRAGPVLETLYARLFPMEFSDDFIGIVGVDSITNRAEGGMELNRYAPLSPTLAAYAGGAERLCEKIRGAFYAFERFVSLLDAPERNRIPVRAEFDLSPLNGLIAEGNADPVRGQCANSRWGRFRQNCAEWTEDALSFYSWKSRKF